MRDKETDIYKYLDPSYLKVDDRSTEELVHFFNQLAEEVRFFNERNLQEGDWSDFLLSDESFLLARIINYPIEVTDRKRLDVVSSFDKADSNSEKEKMFQDLCLLVHGMFKTINSWYLSASKDFSKTSISSVEFELEQLIQNRLVTFFHKFYSFQDSIGLELENTPIEEIEIGSFHPIWKTNQIVQSSILDYIDPTLPKIEGSFKNILLLYAPIYESLYSLIFKSKKLFSKSIELNDTHKPHTGLILAFIKLFKLVQNDINESSKKHLDFFFSTLLNQKKEPKSPGFIFVCFDIDENLEEVFIPENTRVIAGQYEDGENITFTLDNSVTLNSSKIDYLSTSFLSRNQIFDYNSSFRLVTGFYTKLHCSNQEDVEEFNSNSLSFSTFGEDQTLFSADKTTMDSAKIGFAIASSILLLESGRRSVSFYLTLTPDSTKYLSDLILDMSNRSQLSEEDVFYRIFSNAFVIQCSTSEGWEPIKEYNVVFPDDWLEGIIEFKVKFNQQFPSIIPFDHSLHDGNYNTEHPIFEWALNHDDFYYPYSFLEGIELQSVQIDVAVEDYGKLIVRNSSGIVDLTSEFELFGPTPGVGSYLLIGATELFAKRISEFRISWEYVNLPVEYRNLEAYFESYNRGIKDESFKLKVNALADFAFRPSNAPELNMFTTKETGDSIGSFMSGSISSVDLDFKPSFKFRDYLYERDLRDLETGYIRLELVSPREGFGFEIYSKIYTEAMQKAASEKLKDKNSNLEVIPPNEGFSPVINNLKLSYSSSTKFYLDQRSDQNDPKEENMIYHFSPNGIDPIIINTSAKKSSLIPIFEYEGELKIGFSKLIGGQSLDLLFEINKKENTNYEFTPKIEWYYSSAIGWKYLEEEFIISDQTNNLMKTGILSLNIPKDVSNRTGVLGEDRYFLKACSRKRADQFGLIKSIFLNAARATEVVYDPNLGRLKQNSVQSIEPSIDGIVSVNQPLMSSPGLEPESDKDFYIRASKTIRHKFRLVTSWDFEQFILSEFKWVSIANCINSNNQGELVSGVLRILCLKKIEAYQNIEEVKLSNSEMLEINEKLSKYCSPFVKIEIVNPVFEDLWIKCNAIFNGIPFGRGVMELNKDLFSFFCPWIVEKDSPTLPKRFKKTEIISFLKSRPYVQFVTGISIIHLKTEENGMRIFYDSAQDNSLANLIDLGSSRSVIVPRNNHRIQIAQDETYMLPSPVNFRDLAIDENFVIASQQEFSSKTEKAPVKYDQKLITINFKI